MNMGDRGRGYPTTEAGEQWNSGAGEKHGLRRRFTPNVHQGLTRGLPLTC